MGFYISFHKYRLPSKNIATSDIIVLQENGMVPTRWPIARVIKAHAGRDKLVQVVTVKTSTGTYSRPVNKLALLLH